LKEKIDQEGTFFNIQSRLRAMNRPRFKPSDGRTLHDINQGFFSFFLFFFLKKNKIKIQSLVGPRDS